MDIHTSREHIHSANGKHNQFRTYNRMFHRDLNTADNHYFDLGNSLRHKTKIVPLKLAKMLLRFWPSKNETNI